MIEIEIEKRDCSPILGISGCGSSQMVFQPAYLPSCPAQAVRQRFTMPSPDLLLPSSATPVDR
jgi:hypothetical protein